MIIMIMNLKNTIKKYLRNAGFDSNTFVLDDKEMNFVEVFFLTNHAVNFIIIDIEKTDYKNILEIKSYKYRNGNITAIITFKEEDDLIE